VLDKRMPAHISIMPDAPGFSLDGAKGAEESAVGLATQPLFSRSRLGSSYFGFAEPRT
jgi:hypothetical protein